MKVINAETVLNVMHKLRILRIIRKSQDENFELMIVNLLKQELEVEKDSEFIKLSKQFEKENPETVERLMIVLNKVA